MYKLEFSIYLGAVLAVIGRFFGGWNFAMYALVVCCIVDFLSGLTVGLLNCSPKTKNGGLESRYCAKGIFRKIYMFLLVGLAYIVQVLSGVGFLRDTVVIGFCVSEVLSILENCGAMGIPIPKPLLNAIESLKKVGTDNE